MNNVPFFAMNDGGRIPAVGLGTWPLKGSEAVEAVTSGVNEGNILIDSAMNYDNEAAVAEGIRRSSVPRENLFIASKLPGRWHEKELAIQAVEESLLRMRLDYLDLYLIHWPNPHRDLYLSAWQGLIEAQRRGLVKSIGVCNFTVPMLERLINETGVTPAVNQIEMYPYWSKPEIRSFNEKHDIITEAWSPLGRGRDLLENETLVHIAAEKGKTPAQIVLRWAHQLNTVPLPRSSNPERRKQNISIFDFELTAADMKAISSLEGSRRDIAPSDPDTYEQL